MSDDNSPSSWSKFIQENIHSAGDLSAFLLGSSAGVIVDILSVNVTLNQGLIFGGAAGLGIKKGLEGKFAKRKLRKRVAELAKYYRTIEEDIPRADAFDRLLQRIRKIKTMAPGEIVLSIQEILKVE